MIIQSQIHLTLGTTLSVSWVLDKTLPLSMSLEWDIPQKVENVLLRPKLLQKWEKNTEVVVWETAVFDW